MSSSDGIRHNAHDIARRWRGAAGQLEREMAATLDYLAPRVAATMKTEAPKHRSTLTNSITVVNEGRLSRLVRPSVDYAVWVHQGRKPGKGLPRFFDPAAASAVGWLEARLGAAARATNPKWRKARLGSKRRTAYELELRERYMAWSRHVKLHGIKADPFVTRTAQQWRGLAPAALRAAVRRTLDGTGFSGAMD